jgi:cell division protein ZapD
VNLPIDHACYPEINGGKHRFTIRFFEHPVPAERPLQTNHDVAFELACCMA